MLIKIANFSGIAPRVSARLLQDNQAQEATNVRLASGEIRPLRAPLEVAGTLVSNARTIYLLIDKWLSWPSRVKVVASPIADTDSEGRIYYTGDGFPKKTWHAKATFGAEPYPSVNWQGLAVPGFALAATLSPAVGVIPSGTYAYVATLVNRFGPAASGVLEESRPCPATLITFTSPSSVQVTRPALPTTYEGRPVALAYEFWRVYRSNELGQYQLVSGDIPIATTTFDDVLAAPKSTALPSINWHELPDDAGGLVAMVNGVLAAFRGNEVLFCEPWFPHAWPIQYRQTIPAKILAIAPAGASLIVLTDGTPYIITGSHPDSFSQEQINIFSPLASPESVVADGYSVMYASRDGIASISSTGAHDLVSRSMFDIEDWRDLAPSSMVGTTYYGGYLVFYEDHGGSEITKRALWLQTRDSPTLVRVEMAGVAAHKEFFLTETNSILEFDANPVAKMAGLVWRSKVFTVPAPKNFGCVQVQASFPGTVTVKIFADGVLRAERSITSTRTVKLPAGYLARDFELEISADIAVQSVSMAVTMTELRVTS